MLKHPRRLQKQRVLTLESYRKMRRDVELCKEYVELSSRYEVKLRGPFIVIEGAPRATKFCKMLCLSTL
jgi:hypothetical protein